MQKFELKNIIAELISELINLGYNEKDLIWILKQHGMNEKTIKDEYGVPYGKGD